MVRPVVRALSTVESTSWTILATLNARRKIILVDKRDDNDPKSRYIPTVHTPPSLTAIPVIATRTTYVIIVCKNYSEARQSYVKYA